MREIKEYDEFYFNGNHITTDLGSAYYDDEENKIYIEGKCTGDFEVKDVTVILEPEGTPEFHVIVSQMDGELTKSDLDFKARLIEVDFVGSDKGDYSQAA